MKDLYSILGVSRDATADEIKRAYRRRSKETHPDLNAAASAEEFREVQTAFDILSDEEKRRVYDEGGSVDQAEAGLSRLETLLQSALAEIVTRAGQTSRPGNMLEILRGKLEAARRAKERELEELRAELVRVERLRGLIERTAPGPNIFDAAVESRVSSLRLSIAACEADIQDGREMDEILSGFRSAGRMLPGKDDAQFEPGWMQRAWERERRGDDSGGERPVGWRGV